MFVKKNFGLRRRQRRIHSFGLLSLPATAGWILSFQTSEVEVLSIGKKARATNKLPVNWNQELLHILRPGPHTQRNLE